MYAYDQICSVVQWYSSIVHDHQISIGADIFLLDFQDPFRILRKSRIYVSLVPPVLFYLCVTSLNIQLPY